MHYYTVFGLRGRSGVLQVAAVVDGKHPPVGNTEVPPYVRWFRYVYAADPDEAQGVALAVETGDLDN